MRFPDIVLRLPGWVAGSLPPADHVFETVEDRMRAVIELARLNVQHETGGPFAAGVFERDGGRLIAPGVNLVVPAACSIAHAEILAVAIAQRILGSYDLGGEGMPSCELVASTEPCAMCLGAVPWSGVRRLVCGARGEDAGGIGFDEGAKPADWPAELESRGIAVLRDVLRGEARQVLQQYLRSGGPTYDGRLGKGR